jgi:hypothetical protein
MLELLSKNNTKGGENRMKKQVEDCLTVNGVEYVRKDSVKGQCEKAKTLNGKPFVILRTYSAGVFAGYLDKRIGKEAKLLNSRRIWYWEGACSLSQLAVDGTKSPDKCKFAVVVPELEVTEVIEVIQTTEKAKESILGVFEWKK